ncbi:LysR family transcriptional regulator [Rhodobacterales bacterium HKCCE2091]|nr:LysR family transcriptional regulator [Rhodobacterales bacterium HKCCE2091]
MESTPRLDDLSLFLAVADAGGLSGAAKATGASVPTLSRRMTRLETDLGRRLFARGPQGYRLTAEGRALADEAAPLRDAAARLARFADSGGPVTVRITAGQWTSQFLARSLGRAWSPQAPWRPEFLAANANVDLARREADIGIRNRRPEQPWLAGRRTRRIAYAPFATGPGVRGYVTLPKDAATTPSERWLRAGHEAEIVATASTARLAADLALAGIGRVILPVFAAALQPGLEQVGPEIAELSHDEWLVSHHDARHDPPIRSALDAVTAILTD